MSARLLFLSPQDKYYMCVSNAPIFYSQMTESSFFLKPITKPRLHLKTFCCIGIHTDECWVMQGLIHKSLVFTRVAYPIETIKYNECSRS